MEVGLFPSLLGLNFQRLYPQVRNVHGGNSRSLRGTATITRGPSPIARALCALASLPPSGTAVETEVEIVADGWSEQWTRFFGKARPLRSTLHEDHGLLIERVGPATLTFRLHERGGGIEWTLVRVSALGISLPRRFFRVTAFSGSRDEHYTFAVYASIPWVGTIINFEGALNAVSDA